jgi:outer membrane protein assembly factor BamE (lipoprotein component of BamABCDE complex)
MLKISILAVLLASCMSPRPLSDTNKLHIGMTKAELFEALGEPVSKTPSGFGNAYTLSYVFFDHQRNVKANYMVDLSEDDRVMAYGLKAND